MVSGISGARVRFYAPEGMGGGGGAVAGTKPDFTYEEMEPAKQAIYSAKNFKQLLSACERFSKYVLGNETLKRVASRELKAFMQQEQSISQADRQKAARYMLSATPAEQNTKTPTPRAVVSSVSPERIQEFWQKASELGSDMSLEQFRELCEQYPDMLADQKAAAEIYDVASRKLERIKTRGEKPSPEIEAWVAGLEGIAQK